MVMTAQYLSARSAPSNGAAAVGRCGQLGGSAARALWWQR